LASQRACPFCVPSLLLVHANGCYRGLPSKLRQFSVRNIVQLIRTQKFDGGGGVSFFAKDTPETKRLNTQLKAHKAQKAEEERMEKIRAMEGVKKKRDPYVQK
jgi:hypothetical protein